MTQQARMVLADCEESLLELINSTQGTMRRRWVATVGLLRAVGHVLKNVDGKKSVPLLDVIKEKFSELKGTEPDPVIFWGFIENERNNVLKEYLFAVRGNHTIEIPGYDPLRPPSPVLPPGRSIGVGADPPDPRFRISPLEHGPFAGQDPVQVVRQAIQFWRAYLDEIDRLTEERERGKQ